MIHLQNPPARLALPVRHRLRLEAIAGQARMTGGPNPPLEKGGKRKFFLSIKRIKTLKSLQKIPLL